MSAECTCLIPTTGLVLGGSPPSKFLPLHSTPYTLHQKNRTKMRFFLHIRKFCSIFAPWTCAGDVCTSAAKGSRHNKRRLLALVLVVWNPAKFLHPKQESDKCPLVCLIRCVHNDEHISVGIHCLFLLQGLSGTSRRRISKKRFHAFSIIIPTGRLEPTSHNN